MLQTCQILQNQEDNCINNLLTYSTTNLRGSPKKSFKKRTRLFVRQSTFTQRVVDDWNSMSDKIVSASSVNNFKSLYNTYTTGQPEKFTPICY